ncbi:hypothetical protein TorRG33x02_348310 [Trema orientale]|uniref:Uncharacterized protein n=1 Tax=Trema orientale TaxID=63057 RepID=A0A2P5AK72_TREOI|nr:hypothetical protein TorRG33x02_348310 [Trema orientale]
MSVIVATTLATMLPFFGDQIALFGALGNIPILDVDGDLDGFSMDS